MGVFLIELVDGNSYKCSRFSGITMNVSCENQVDVMRIVCARPVENIYRIALTISSKCCEQYFRILAKYTQGKRSSLDKIHSWKGSQYFITGIRSIHKFTSAIFKAAGVIEAAFVFCYDVS